MVEISERVRCLAANGGWIGVDLDGTLFTFPDGDVWIAWNVFGEPIKSMVDRVKAWLAAGIDVRIFTARIALPEEIDSMGLPIYDIAKNRRCPVTGDSYSDWMMEEAICAHLRRHGLPALVPQCYKDVHTIEIWDDRAIQVVANTGRTLAEEHAALAALRGKQFGGSQPVRTHASNQPHHPRD